jgi:nucleoside-diphosphate-sugar epimerase
MRILVTGGAGYLGSVFVRLARSSGHEITVLDRSGMAGGAAGSALRCVRGDIRDRSVLRSAVADTDAIVHLAAISGHPACDRDPGEARGVNVEGTRAVCEAAGSRPVVFASTGSVYGAVPGGLCTETSPAAPVSLYGVTKHEAEGFVRQAEGVCLRFATCYGLSPRMRLDLLVNHFVDVLVREGRIEVYEADARRTFLHVSDAARAILHVLASPWRFAGGVYNAGDEAQNLTKREVLERIRAQMPGAIISYGSAGADLDCRDYAVSFALLRATGYRAVVSLDDGIRELVEGLRCPISPRA